MKSRILIIEDSMQDFEFLKKTLSADDYDILHEREAKNTISLLEEKSPDLLVLDLVLPGTDGFEICRQVRADERFTNMPILFLTSVNNMDNRIIGLQLGASDFLSKECDPRELALRIRNLLRSKKVFDEVVKLSVVDGLTHVYNRRYFQHRLLDEFERGKRYNRDFCCLIIDVDNFKQVNDTLGHPAGDLVLKRVAAILRRNIRSADVLCRYGGDEFGLLLPETNFKGASVTAERIRSIVEKTDVGKPQYSAKVTLSVGVSSLLEGGALGMDELVTQADVALYQSKRHGRNQVSYYGKKE